MKKDLTIAIDGPAGAGKSTVAYQAARRLGYLYLDTGVMYRAVTYAALERSVDISDEAAIVSLAEQIQIDIVTPEVNDGSMHTVYVDQVDVTSHLHSAAVDSCVSPVSEYAGVRAAMTEQQRRFGERGRVVMVGRDIGTAVFPDADLKFYLDATVEVRARRRWLDYRARGRRADYDDILAALKRRDQIDSQRALSPLQAADDAIVIDTTSLSALEVLDQVMAIVEKRLERVGHMTAEDNDD
jgi:cytidylate kinase